MTTTPTSYKLQAQDRYYNASSPEYVNSSPITVSVFAADISPLKVAMDKGFNTTITGIAAGGKKPYRYQWYAEAPNQTSLTASEANTLLGVGNSIGEAQNSRRYSSLAGNVSPARTASNSRQRTTRARRSL